MLIFLTYPLAATAAYLLARRFVGDAPAALAGFLFAFTRFRVQKLYHFHQLGVFYLPLVLLLTERWLERARARDAVLLAAALAFQSLSSFCLAYALALLYGPHFLLALWRWRTALDARRVVGLAAVCVLGAVPFLLASLPYVELRELGVIPSYGQDQGGWTYTLHPAMTMLQV